MRLRAAVSVGFTALLAAYLLVRAVDLFRTGTTQGAVLGVGVLLLVAVGIWLVAGEVRLAAQSQRLGRKLFAEGFREEDLPTTAGGRIERQAADALFEKRKAQVEATPDDWRAWFALATAYDAARDPQRGRRAMRQAIALERLSRS